MAVGLFTSRVVLNTLGISDYGINNVVAGFVSMFSLLTSSLSAAIGRFINVSLGKGDIQRLKTLFSSSVTIMLLMSAVILVLAEPISIWFLNNKMNIPEDRMYAANWVLQFSLLSFVVNLISVPYNATIIAHEKMNVYAYMSIFDVTMKLIIVYMLYISPFDKLITYSFLFLCVGILDRIIYGIYCGRHFEEAHYHFVFDKSLLKDMGEFAVWNLFGSGAYLFNTQGVNIVTNIFFGVTANAARGVANQVEGIVKQFVTNFTTAINPQIMKSYAKGDMDYLYSLVCRGAKFSYLLMLLFVVPFMFETETIMRLWLKNYPPEAPIFLRLSMIGTLFDMLGNSTANAAWATGRIKKYYMYVATIGCLVFPLSWALFALGCPAYTSYIVLMVIYFILIFIKVNIIRGLINFNPMMFYKDVLGRVLPTTITSFIIPGIIYFSMQPSLLRTGVVILVSGISTVICILYIGMTKHEREKTIGMAFRKIRFNKQ
jgi:O-antigen/teichoic acid export membrane protein